MKNLKKVLALVMAFAMAFTMFAGAVNFSDVKPGDDYSAAISMLSDLEVISGNGKGAYEPAKAVTRAEACVLIANMMNGGKADTARFAGGSNFSDVAKGWWGESAIAYCVQNGITYGVGGGKFAPNREITDAEFVAMMTRAMGYDTAANPLSFPYGNYTAAVNNGLLDNMPYAEGSACTKGECAQIIYDALFADYARLTANMNVIHKADDYDHDNKATLIEDVFGLHRAADAEEEKCTQHYWVILGQSCEDEDVIYAAPITDKKCEADYSNKAIVEFDCEADVSALIGRKVVLWGENTHAASSKTWEVDTVKAVETVNGQKAYDYNPTMDWEDDLNLDEVKTARLVMHNGVVASKDIESTIEKKNGNSYVLIDWDDDGEVDYITVTERFYGEVDTLTSKRISLNMYGQQKDVILDLADGEVSYTCVGNYCCNGKAVKHDVVVNVADDVEEDDVIVLTYTDGYDQTLTIDVEKVASDVKEFTKWDSKQKYYFDDEKMEANEDGENNLDLTKKDVGNDYEIWVDANGYIVKYELSDEDSGFLMIAGIEDGERKSVKSKSTKANMDVIFADGDGSIENVDVAFDCDAVATIYDEDDYTFGNQKDIVGAVYEYTLNDNGEIDSLEKCATVKKAAYSYDEKYEELYYTDTENTNSLTGDDYIFVVDDEYVSVKMNVYSVDEDKVAIIKLDDLTDIDEKDTTYAKEGAYKDAYINVNGYKADDQKISTDKVDGALMVVRNLNKYLGSSEHVGLITFITYDKNEQYTFEMAVDGQTGVEYKTIEVDKAKHLKDSDIDISDDDAELIELLADNDMKLTEKDNYLRNLYAYIGLNKDGEIDEIELLVEKDGNKVVPKTETEVENGYAVKRGVIASVAKNTDSLKLISGDAVVGYVDGKNEDGNRYLINLDEYKDSTTTSAVTEYDFAKEFDVYVDETQPYFVTGDDVTANIGFDEDSDISVGSASDVVASTWKAKDGADIYVIADVIFSVDDDDEADEIESIFIFDDVQEVDPDVVKEDLKKEEAKNEALKDAKDALAKVGPAQTALKEAQAVLTEKQVATAKAKAAYDAAVLSGDGVEEAKVAYDEAVAAEAEVQKIVDERQATYDAAEAAYKTAKEAYLKFDGASESDIK